MKLLTIAAAADRLSVSIDTLRGLVRDGEMRFVNVGRGKVKPRIMFTDRDIDDFVTRRSSRVTLSKSRKANGAAALGSGEGFAALRKKVEGMTSSERAEYFKRNRAGS
jgi:excisionase family DNA binding protein